MVDAQAPARVSVDGLALPFGNHYLLRPGDYEVSVTAAGYQPLVTTVTVDERDNQTVESVATGCCPAWYPSTANHRAPA